jgi:hypothetical protein
MINFSSRWLFCIGKLLFQRLYCPVFVRLFSPSMWMKQLYSGAGLSQKMIIPLHQLQWTLMVAVALCRFLEHIIVDHSHQRSKEKQAFGSILLSPHLQEAIHTHLLAHIPPCRRYV